MALHAADRSAHNLRVTCLEEIRLKDAYDAVLNAWKKNRQILGNVVYSIDQRSRFRRELLDARFKAANDLYGHCVRCPRCKISRLNSFDAVG
jgi:uncharacterized Fe-S radical SAM superfamily protein PflX